LKLLVLTDTYLPDRVSGAALVHDLVGGFAAEGHSVTVLTPARHKLPKAVVQEEDGATVIRFWAGRLKGVSLAQRAWNEFNLSRRAESILKIEQSQQAWDGIVFYSPSIFWGSLVRRLKRNGSGRAFLILRDIFPQWAIDARIMHEGVISAFFRYYERLQYRAADVIGVQMERDIRYFDDRAREYRDKAILLRNWSETTSVEPKETYRREWGIGEKILCIYGGNVGRAQGLENLVEIAALLKGDSRIHIAIVGDGTEVNRIRNEIDVRGLTNIRYYGSLPQEEFLLVMAEADVGLVFLDPRLTTNNFPGKLLSYMRAGIPIVAGVNKGAEIVSLINTEKIGIAEIADNHEKIAADLRMLAENNALRRSMGQRSRQLLRERFSTEKAVQLITQSLINRAS